MRQFLFMLFVWTSFYYWLPAVAIAREDRADSADRPRIEQQMERIRMAQNELNEQRQQIEIERQELERQRDQMRQERERQTPNQMNKGENEPLFGLLVIMCLAVHILVTIWVFQDIRTRGTGSGLWIVIALIAGLLGALVYAVVRLGDVKQTE